MHGVDINGIFEMEFKRIRADKGTGIMHQKFCVIDDNIVITGFYN